MDLLAIIMIAGAGIVGGVIAGMVGGGSIITFPVMLAVGLPPVMATASNIVALTVANITGAFGDMKNLPSWNKSFAALVGCSILGSAAGAVLLLCVSETWFAAFIPLLMGIGTAAFAFPEQLKRLARAGKSASSAETSSIPQLALITATAAYGSFFGASFTVLLLAILSLTISDLRVANVPKNVLAGVIGSVAVVIFVVQSVVTANRIVAPLPTIVLTAGASAGGYLGGRLVRAIPREPLRWIVIGIGTLLTVYYARRYWFA
jgi:uncharacterized protein